MLVHLLPFFFFFPPPDCAGCTGCTGVAARLPCLSPSAPSTVLTGASGIASTGDSAGKPAIQRPSRPSADCTRRVTSAAFVVRYLRFTPLTGSYVVMTRLPRGGFKFSATSASLVAPSRALRDGTVLIEYLVVIRVFASTEKKCFKATSSAQFF